MIPKEFWEHFKNENIAVKWNTENERNNFIKQCNDNGINNLSSISTIYYYDENEPKFPKVIHEKYKNDGIEHWCIKYLAKYGEHYYSYEIFPYSEINKSIKEETKMQFKPNEYTYRGQVFTDVEEYAKYILKCKNEDRVKSEQERQNKLKAEKEKRIEELDKARVEYFETCTEAKEKYLKIVEQYNKDYGYEIKEKYPYLDDIFDSIQKVFNL